MVWRALSDKTYLLLGLLSPLNKQPTKRHAQLPIMQRVHPHDRNYQAKEAEKWQAIRDNYY